jgi:phage terminase large subunit-like protein
VLEIADHIRSLATRTRSGRSRSTWRAGQLAAELEREGLVVSAFPMTDTRTIPASARLHSAIVEQRITLPEDPEIARHAADAIARDSRRGWRIDKPTKRTHIDGVIALMMAVDRVETQPAPVTVLGWL